MLKYATATPLCILRGEEEVAVFYGKADAQFSFEGQAVKVLLLSREDALNVNKLTLDRDYLVYAEGFSWVEEGKLVVEGGACTRIKTYPALSVLPDGFVADGTEGEWSCYLRQFERALPEYSLEAGEQTAVYRDYTLMITYPERSNTDYLLWLDYSAEHLEVFSEGKKINDHFYTGQHIPLRLGYLAFPQKITLRLYPLLEDAEIYLEKRPSFIKGQACCLNAVHMELLLH